MYAEEMGCDWLAPIPVAANVSVFATTLYCHREIYIEDNNGIGMRKGDLPTTPSERCTLTNWLKYYGYEDEMTRHPVHDRVVVQVSFHATPASDMVLTPRTLRPVATPLIATKMLPGSIVQLYCCYVWQAVLLMETADVDA